MKFRVTMKTPDALWGAVESAVHRQVADQLPALEGIEFDGICDGRVQAVRQECRRWFKYDEYLTVEIDLHAKTCTVVEARP